VRERERENFRKRKVNRPVKIEKEGRGEYEIGWNFVKGMKKKRGMK
jgi:hypothetical protein